jgi:hypothetical protein
MNDPVNLRDRSGKWSSKDLPLFEPVHQKAIEKVLRYEISKEELEILQHQQEVADAKENQKNDSQPTHAMAGKGMDRTEAISKANLSVKTNLTQALDKNNRQRFIDLGNAIHTLQDASSPAHGGFQIWDNDGPFADHVDHVLLENAYPERNAYGAKTEYLKMQLEGATRWAYEIFTKKEPMPENFFDPETGELLLPKRYMTQPQN